MPIKLQTLCSSLPVPFRPLWVVPFAPLQSVPFHRCERYPLSDIISNLFTNLWGEAEKQIIEADKIFVIGYSFPKTDLRSSELFKKAFSLRTTMPEVVIINPAPEPVEERFVYDLGITADKLITVKDYFDSEIIKNVIANKIK